MDGFGSGVLYGSGLQVLEIGALLAVTQHVGLEGSLWCHLWGRNRYCVVGSIPLHLSAHVGYDGVRGSDADGTGCVRIPS